jgi:cell division protein FtsB
MFAKIKQYQTKVTAYAKQLRDLRVVGLLLFLVIVVLVSWSGVKTIETNYNLQKKIARLKQENTVKKLANDNLKLENDYFDTTQYLELAARQNFGLAAPGETVLNVSHATAMAQTANLPKLEAVGEAKAATKQSAYQRNFQAWMDFLLHRRQSPE